MNSHPFLQKDNVREYLKALQQRDTQCEKKQFVDKGKDTLFNSYTEDEFEGIYCKLWARGTALSPECHFCIFVNILLGHYMLICGSDRCSAEILNLFIFEFKGEGPTCCMPLIFTTCTDKQNQYGCFKTIRALYNKKLLICMLSGLAFYLLYCWDFSNKPFSDFSKWLAQYNICLIKSSARDHKAAFLYNLQQKWVTKAFQNINIFLQKKTHIG